MRINELKTLLQQSDQVTFRLPDGSKVPSHFHVTEVGKIVKDYIDCGGTVRHEEVASMQLWSSIDLHHRLKPAKLISIIELSQDKLGLGDLDIEVEYQGDTIGKYGLDHDGSSFVLTSKATDCLAKDNCGIPKVKLDLSALTSGSCCTPESGCC